MFESSGYSERSLASDDFHILQLLVVKSFVDSSVASAIVLIGVTCLYMKLSRMLKASLASSKVNPLELAAVVFIIVFGWLYSATSVPV